MTVTQLASYGSMTRGPGTAAGPSIDWIMGTLERRRQDRSKVLEQMRLVRDCYNGELIVPLPELDTAESSSVANLIVTGIDQTAQRIASVMPSIDYPALRPGIKVSDEKARTRTLANMSWWDQNRLSQKMRRRSRWLIGYGSAPAVIRPNYTKAIPVWETRDPLSAYPCPTQDPDDITPPDAIFTFFKSWKWLRDCYPEAAARLAIVQGTPNQIPGNMQYEIVEYMDADVTVLGVLGQKQFGSQWGESMGLATSYVELERVATPGGICPAVVPGRVTLDRPQGQFDGAIGMYQLQARLMALEVLAVERGVFPDTYLISRQNETAQFVSGPHDGRTGLVNIVKGGDIREQNLNPGFATTGVMDRLERAQRISSGVPAEFGGESPTNVRTGKRGDAVMAGVVAFPVQEAQEIFAAALEEENRRAVAIMKSCFGNERKSFYITQRGKAQAVDYVPNEAFETDVCRVTYAMAGADQNGLVVGLGQRVGMGMMSKRSAQEIDPMIADPEREHDRVVSEALEAAVLAALQAQAQQGTVTPADISRIAELVASNQMDLYGAIGAAQKEAQARQASSGEPGTPTGPAQPGSPEAQPGLAMPGQGQEVPTVGPPPQGAQNVRDFLRTLRGGGGVQ